MTVERERGFLNWGYQHLIPESATYRMNGMGMSKEKSWVDTLHALFMNVRYVAFHQINSYRVYLSVNLLEKRTL